MANNGAYHHHVAVFAFPFGSHGTPLLNITRRLASLLPPNNNNSNVKFSFFTTPNNINLLFPKSDDDDDGEFPNIIRCFEMWDGKPQGYVFKGNPLEEIHLFLKAAAAPGALREAVAVAEAEIGMKVTCVMGDAFLWFLGDLAQEIGVPWVSCWVSGEHSLSIHLYADLIRERFGTQGNGIEGKEEETLNMIPGLSKIRIKDLQDGVVTDDLSSTFSIMLHQMSRALPRAKAICVSSCEELDPIVTRDLRTKFSTVLLIGPLNLVMPSPKVVDTYQCLGWLDKHEPKSVVYLSLGSAATPTPTEIVALALALEASRLNFLWSIKDHLKVHFPNGFLENTKEKGLVVPWVPQREVLAHKTTGVFITHFGYNSVTESIAAQVPMIGRPFFGDQKLNGRLVEAVWGIGCQMQDGFFTKVGILNCLDRILRSHEGQKMRENLRNLSDLMGRAVAPNGSSNQNFKLLLDVITKS